MIQLQKIKFLSEVRTMLRNEKITQLKQEIKLMQDKLGQTIENEKIFVSTSKTLEMSKELDELIVKYYENENLD
jgi:hypothetical protein